jgi:dynamin 1/3
MEESPEEERRRDELLRMYHACKEAIRIIGDVSMATSYSPAPPPLKNDWQLRADGPSPTPPSPSAMGPRSVPQAKGPPPPQNRGAPPPAPPGRPAPTIPGRGGPPQRGMPPPMVPT